ncbi:hypothetical protein B0H16DRAFT_1886489, partial [Mycena metata]
MGTATATGEEGDWERSRDAEGSTEVALIGPLALAVGGGGAGAGSTIAAPAPQQQHPRLACGRARTPPAAAKPSTPAPGHASSSSVPPSSTPALTDSVFAHALPHALRGRNHSVSISYPSSSHSHTSGSGSQAGGIRKCPLEPLTPAASVDGEREQGVVILVDLRVYRETPTATPLPSEIKVRRHIARVGWEAFGWCFTRRTSTCPLRFWRRMSFDMALPCPFLNSG